MAETKPGTPPGRARIGNTGEEGRRQPAPCLGHHPRGEELPINHLVPVRRVKVVRLEADKPPMDAHGAKLLAARIRAGVSVGMRIELTTDAGDESGLRAGDRGVVHEVDDHGRVVVLWDRGFETEIDPTSTQFHRLAA